MQDVLAFNTLFIILHLYEYLLNWGYLFDRIIDLVVPPN